MPFVTEPYLTDSWNLWDFTALALTVIGGVVLLMRKRLPDGLGVSILITCASLALGIASFRLKWPLTEPLPLVRRLAAALCAIWAAFGWVTREPPRRTVLGDSDRSVSHGLQPTSCFFAGAMTTGLLAFILVVYPILSGLFARLVQQNVFELLEAGRPNRHGLEGASDIVAVLLACTFWRLSGRDRMQPVITITLLGLLVVWLSLLIPGGVLGASVESGTLLPRPMSLPIWWSWSLNMQVGLALLVFGLVRWRDRVYKKLRAKAWPQRLDLLLEPYPVWHGAYEALAIISAMVVIIGVYHLVRQDVPHSPAGPISAAACMTVAMSCFFAAYRQWHTNIAGLGLSAFATTIVSCVVVLYPEPAGIEYVVAVPIRLNAALLGLVVAVWYLLWMSGVWHQQVETAEPWTTTGRLVPHARRVGFMLAALAVMIGFNMAVWPRNTIAVAYDNNTGRMIAGNGTLLAMALVLRRNARNRRDTLLAALAISCLGIAMLFTWVRLTSDQVGVLQHYLPGVLAVLTLPLLLLAQRTHSPRHAAFAGPLTAAALLFVPAIALLLTHDRTLQFWAQPTTCGILALTYALAAWRGKRGLFWLPSAVLLVISILTLWRNMPRGG